MNETQTICIFSALYLPHIGGVENYTHKLALKLKEKGHNVIIVSSGEKEGQPKEKSMEGTIYRLPANFFIRGSLPIPIINKKTKTILNEISQHNPNIVVINTRFYIHSLLGAIFAKRKHIKSILIEHGTGHIVFDNKIISLFGRWYEHLLTFFIKKQCNAFYGVSKACNDWLKHFNILANGTLCNSIDVEQTDRQVNNCKVDYLANNSIHDKAIIIAYVGRLVKEKGVEKLIEAFTMLQQTQKNIYLFIAGEGKILSDIKKYKNDGVIFLGRLGNTQALKLLSQTDIFCLPTDYPEGLPTSVLEAIACKSYVITTRNGGAKEVIISKEYGFILDENTVDNLKNAIEFAIDDEKQRRNAIENAYNRVQKYFSWDCCADKLIDISREMGN